MGHCLVSPRPAQQAVAACARLNTLTMYRHSRGPITTFKPCTEKYILSQHHALQHGCRDAEMPVRLSALAGKLCGLCEPLPSGRAKPRVFDVHGVQVSKCCAKTGGRRHGGRPGDRPGQRTQLLSRPQLCLSVGVRKAAGMQGQRRGGRPGDRPGQRTQRPPRPQLPPTRRSSGPCWWVPGGDVLPCSNSHGDWAALRDLCRGRSAATRCILLRRAR